MATEELEQKLSKDFSNYQVSSQDEIPSICEERFGIAHIWSDAEKCVYCTPASETVDFRVAKFQTLIPSLSPVFKINRLKISHNGQYAAIFGQNGLAVIEMPRKWGSDGEYEGGKSTVHCRVSVVDETYFRHHISTKICQVAWYPGSPNDGHLLVLTNDNCLRFYDINMPDQPMFRLPLFDGSRRNLSGSLSSFASIIGDVAVDFDIADPIVDDQGVATYPVYAMQECGDVWVLYCKLLQNRIDINQHGPLTMHPPASDNYGCAYSSILCLPTSPTVVALATSKGWIHHCIVLESDAEEETDFGELSSLDALTEKKPVNPKVGLYVYESVELDLTFIPSPADVVEGDGQSGADKITELKLQLDPKRQSSYICMSNGGVHMVALPWVDDLDRFLASGAMGDWQDSGRAAAVSYVLCTKPSSNSPSNVPCGCVISRDEDSNTLVTCILSSGEIVCVTIQGSSNDASDLEGILDASRNSHDSLSTSPLRRLRGSGGFDVYIRNLLARNSTVPVIRSGGGDKKISADDYYQILTKTTQVLREEYMQKMIIAKIELEKRCSILQTKKKEQMKDVASLDSEMKNDLSSAAVDLGSKLEVCQEKSRDLVDRLEFVLRKIQSSSPVLSDEEREWSKEVSSMQSKLIKLRRYAELVKTKHENMLLREIPIHNKVQKPARSLSSSQAINLRGILKEQDSRITGLVDELQSLSCTVGT